MGETVGIFGAVFGLVIALALLCALIYCGMRSQSSLLWLAATLLCSALEIVVLTFGYETWLQITGATVLMPLKYLCASQTIRLAIGRSPSSVPFVATIAVLVCVSLVIAGMGIETVYQTLPFKTAAALALIDMLLCLGRLHRKSPLDYALLAAIVMLAVVFILRIPVYPAMEPQELSVYGLTRLEIERLLVAITAFLAPIAAFLIVAKVLGGVIASYHDRSEHDPLTDLFNRRAFDRMAAGMRQQSGVVVLCDIDHFRRINDRYGRDVGDAVIQAAGRILLDANVSAARLGGGEFALLLPGTSVAEGVSLAVTIRTAIGSVDHPGLDAKHRLTASFGVAAFSPQEPIRDALSAAEEALSRAKNAGRDRVAIHPSGLIVPNTAPHAA